MSKRLAFAGTSHRRVVNKGATWPESRFVLKVEPTGFTDLLLCESEGNVGPKDNPYLFGLSNRMNGVISRNGAPGKAPSLRPGFPEAKARKWE